MFILLTLGLFILKFLALSVVCLFFIEDLELTSRVNSAVYYAYFAIACITALSLVFFVLGRKILWLIMFLVIGFGYLFMYNEAPGIREIHAQTDLKSRYFKDSGTFIIRMHEVANNILSKL